MKSLCVAGLLALCAMFFLPAGHAQDSTVFTVGEIRIQGLDRIERGTVLAYTGFGLGDQINEQVLSAAIARLFDTGLFRDIEIAREGDDVIIILSENPTINNIRFEGMEALNEDTVLDLIKGQDIAVGRVFKRDTGESIVRIMGSFYRQSSYFLSSVQVVTVPLENNRIDLAVVVSEGEPSRISSIAIHGTEVFDEDSLLDLFELRTSGLINSFFDRDVYKQEVFEGDLERLRQYYFERGYIRLEILSSDVRVLTSSSGIAIDILVAEGAQYRFGSYQFTSPVKVDEQDIEAVEVFAEGEVYSESEVEVFRQQLRQLLRNRGYAFAQIELTEHIDDERFRVDLAFTADPDQIVEVRRIEFTGNDQTRDEVLRRQLEILENETFSQEKLDYSLLRLRRNQYLRHAEAIEKRVGEDQMDIDFNVIEDSRGRFLIGAGFSNASGVSFSLDILRNNILGSGNDLDLGFSTGDDETTVSVAFTEPNITDSGITRSFRVYSTNDKPDNDVTVENTIDRLGSALSYNVPIDRNWSWDTGTEYERSKLNRYNQILDRTDPTEPFDNQANAYATLYGESQNTFYLFGGLRYNSLNRSFDPSEGITGLANLRVSTFGSDAKYYQALIRGDYYAPVELGDEYVLKMSGQARYGDTYGSDDIFPFYKRYLLPSSLLRGFDVDRLGPQGNNRSIGGRFLLAASAEISRPLNVLDGESVRGGVFVDSAGLWDSVSHFQDANDDLKVAAGVFLKVRTPIFPIVLSYGIPVRSKDADQLQKFQFRVGF